MHFFTSYSFLSLTFDILLETQGHPFILQDTEYIKATALVIVAINVRQQWPDNSVISLCWNGSYNSLKSTVI